MTIDKRKRKFLIQKKEKYVNDTFEWLEENRYCLSESCYYFILANLIRRYEEIDILKKVL